MRAAASHCLFALIALIGCQLTLAGPTLNDYAALPETSFMALSPSGDRLAFRKQSPDMDLLTIISLADNKVLRSTDISQLQAQQIYFAGENFVILRMSQRKRIFGYRGEHDISTAFVLDIAGGNIQQLLTPGDNIYYAQTGLGRIVGVSPDLKTLYMPAYVGRDEHDTQPDLALMKVRMDKPRRPKRLSRGKQGTNDYFVDNRGNIIARESYHNHKNLHQLEVPDGRNWRVVFEQESPLITTSFVALTPDFKSAVMLHTHPDTGRDTYSTLSLADGSLRPDVLGQHSADVETVYTDLNRTAVGVRFGGLKPSYQFFDEDVEARMRAIVAQFPDDGVWLSSWSHDWQRLLVYVEGDTTSGDYYLFSAHEKPRYLAAARPNIQPEHLHPTGHTALTARDGLRIPLMLTIPKTRAHAMKNLPAVVMPHGGPEAYDRTEFDWLAQALAEQGYLVIKPQFRGSAGYGADHLLAGHGEWGRKMQDDITDTVNALVSKKIIDPERVCIVGASYGGYAALAGGAFTPDLYRCVVSINGVSDLAEMLSFERKRYGKHHWVITYFEQFMVPGTATPDKLNAVSPSQHAKKIQAPVLLIHGENDETVPLAQSEIMYDALKGAGRPVQWLELPEENHHLRSEASRRQTLNTLVTFLNQHTGLAPGEQGRHSAAQ